MTMTETKAKHTPGPWQVVDTTDHRSAVYIRQVGWQVGEMAVARVMQGRDYDEQQANARLIAAAPEMLEALERSHLHFLQSNDLSVDDREVLDEMWAAIRKAKGEL